MNDGAHTPSEIAAEVRVEMDRAAIRAARESTLRSLGLGTEYLIEQDMPLAAWELLRSCGVTEGQALDVMEGAGVAGEVLDLLHVPEMSSELSERPDKG